MWIRWCFGLNRHFEEDERGEERGEKRGDMCDGGLEPTPRRTPRPPPGGESVPLDQGEGSPRIRFNETPVLFFIVMFLFEKVKESAVVSSLSM